ncbi:MAG: hypothetical protein KDA24_02655 [Deltaproteobacteria bacterium]|nr:hypothetical protein [Deltaproteobacteria bacterium]
MSGLGKLFVAAAVGILILVGLAMAVGGIAAKAGKEMAEEAETFAASTDERGCLTETVKRSAGCDGGVVCLVKLASFEMLCFMEAHLTEGFCVGVPDPNNETTAGAWRHERCQEQGIPEGETCDAVMGVYQAYCHSDERPPDAVRQSSETVNSTSSGSSKASESGFPTEEAAKDPSGDPVVVVPGRESAPSSR